MATSRTRNLRLFLSSGLSTEAKANLEIIDRLGTVYQVDNSEAVNIRSKTDIRILAGDPAAGGAGNSKVFIGSESIPVSEFKVHASVFELNGSLRLPDYKLAIGQQKYLTLRYDSSKRNEKSDFPATNRELTLNVQDGNRSLTIGQDVEFLGGFLTKLNTTNTTDIVLPTSGTVATLDNAETLTNKTLISPHLVGVSGLTKADVGLSAVENYSVQELANIPQTLENKTIDGSVNHLYNVAYASVVLNNSITDSDIQSNAAIHHSKLNIKNAITDAHISDSAVINAKKIVLKDDKTFVPVDLPTKFASIEQQLTARLPVVTFDKHTAEVCSHGTTSPVVGANDVQTLTNKTIDAETNTITNLTDASLHPQARIAATKLDLEKSLKNSDWSTAVEHKLSGEKIDAKFGQQFVETESGLKIGQTFKTVLAVQSQTQNLWFRFPTNAGGLNYVLSTDGQGNTSWIPSSATGSVSKVGVLPTSDVFEVITRDGSGRVIPKTAGEDVAYIAATGYVELGLAAQPANKVLAAPINSTNVPTFRSLVEQDLPAPLNSAENRNQMISEQVYSTLKSSQDNALSWLYNARTKTVTPMVTLAPFTTSNLTEGVNLYYQDERVDTKVKTMFAANNGSTSGISVIHGPDFISLNLNLPNTSVTTGTYGAASKTVTLAVDAKGRLTSAVQQDISIATHQIKNFTAAVEQLAGKSYTSVWSTADGVEKIISHKLQSSDVFIQVYDLDTGRDVLVESVVRTDANTVTLTAANAPSGSGWKILIRSV